MDKLTARYSIRNKFDKYQKSMSDLGRLAYVGDANGNVDVPNRPGYIYVSLNDAPSIEVFNKVIQPHAGMPVLIGYAPYEPWLLQVLSATTSSSDTVPASYTPITSVGPHASTHRIGGTDPVYLTKRNLLDLQIGPGDYTSGSARVDAWGDVVYTGGQWREVIPITLDLSSSIPAAGSSRYVLISVNSSGSFVATAGNVVAGYVPALTDIPATPAGNISVGAVRLYGGMNYLSENDEYTDFVDLRAINNPAIYTGDTATLHLALTGALLSGSVIPGGIALDTLGAPSNITTLNASVTAHGLLPRLSGSPGQYLDGTGAWVTVTGSGGSPAPHATTHEAGGTDVIALDLLGAPTDITTLNASGSAHGLLPKLSNVAAQFLNGSGAWATLAGTDGWIPDANTWTYVNATQATVTGDQTGTYQSGMPIKVTNGGVIKFFYLVSAVYTTLTTLTLTGGSDYVLASGSITNVFYARNPRPQGFPFYFAYTPTWGGFSAAPAGVGYFCAIGKLVIWTWKTNTVGTSNATNLTASMPIAMMTAIGNMTVYQTWGRAGDNGTGLLTPGRVWCNIGAPTTLNADPNPAGGLWTASSTKYVDFTYIYLMGG